MSMTPKTTTAIATATTDDQRAALPMMESSGWTSSSCSSGGGVGMLFIEQVGRGDELEGRLSFHRGARVQQPGFGMMCEADVRIVSLRGRRGEQQQRGLRPARRLRAADQFLADALPLVRGADRQIGQVSDVAKVRQRARNADE